MVELSGDAVCACAAPVETTGKKVIHTSKVIVVWRANLVMKNLKIELPDFKRLFVNVVLTGSRPRLSQFLL